MNKFALITLGCVLMVWLRVAVGPTVHDDPAIAFGVGCTYLWLFVFGCYYGWMLLLRMVRQLGAAVRGK